MGCLCHSELSPLEGTQSLPEHSCILTHWCLNELDYWCWLKVTCMFPVPTNEMLHPYTVILNLQNAFEVKLSCALNTKTQFCVNKFMHHSYLNSHSNKAKLVLLVSQIIYTENHSACVLQMSPVEHMFIHCWRKQPTVIPCSPSLEKLSSVQIRRRLEDKLTTTDWFQLGFRLILRKYLSDL